MVSVKIVRESSGNPVASCRVTVWYGGSTVRHTNEKGIAHFEDIPPGKRSVYVEGVDMGEKDLSGETVIYI